MVWSNEPSIASNGKSNKRKSHWCANCSVFGMCFVFMLDHTRRNHHHHVLMTLLKPSSFLRGNIQWAEGEFVCFDFERSRIHSQLNWNPTSTWHSETYAFEAVSLALFIKSAFIYANIASIQRLVYSTRLNK